MGDFELLALHFEWEHLVPLSRHPPRREDFEKLSRRRSARRHLFFLATDSVLQLVVLRRLRSLAREM
jgi:hypothetical protein